MKRITLVAAIIAVLGLVFLLNVYVDAATASHLTYVISQPYQTPTRNMTLLATGYVIDAGTLGTFPADLDVAHINGLHSAGFVDLPTVPTAYGMFGLDFDAATGAPIGFAAAFTNDRAAAIVAGHLTPQDVFGFDGTVMSNAVANRDDNALYTLWVETPGMQLAYGPGWSVGGDLVHFRDYSQTSFVSVMDVLPEPAGVAWGILLSPLVGRTTRRGRRRVIDRARFPPAEVGRARCAPASDHV